jgi:hypothetical protein
VRGGNHVAVRIDDATLAAVDALIPTLSHPWQAATRSDALRYLILAGIAAVEPQEPAPKGKPARKPRK